MSESIYQGGVVQVKAYRIIQAAVASVVKANGIGSTSEWFMLSHIQSEPGTTARQLAALLDVEAPLVTVLVGNLMEAGLVTSSPHPTDGRAKLLRATHKAGGVLRKVDTALEASLEQVLAGIRPEELKTYRRVLDRIVKNGE